MVLVMDIGLPSARVLAEGMAYGNMWVIATVEAPRLRTLMNGRNGLVRLRLPWVVFITRYFFTGDVIDFFDLSVYGTETEPDVDTPLSYLNLPHSIGDVCLGTAEDAVWDGLSPEDAFWNSDFVEGIIDPSRAILAPSNATVAGFLNRPPEGPF